MYDYLICGSGFYAATFARIVTDAGKKCLVIDKNPHLGGMAADVKMEGINVSLHGAHIFHTHSEGTWNFVNQFGTFNNFINRPKVLANGKVYSFPINLMTFQQLWGTVTPEDVFRKLNEVRIINDAPANAEEWILSIVGKEVYELFFYGYTKKQWGREPKDLPASIVKRLPVRLTYDEDYFDTKYQGMPVDGYSALIKDMLYDVDVELGVDFFDIDWKKYAKNLVYTGPVDKFFGYQFGKLDYGTMNFEHKVYEGDFQGNAVFNHPDLNVPYLRTVEHKHFTTIRSKHQYFLPHGKTVVSYDIPATVGEPYYPIRDEKNTILSYKYAELASELNNVIIGGRLGSYAYIDMDQAISAASFAARKVLNV